MKKHSCEEYLELDREHFKFDGDYVIFNGRCTVCGRELKEYFLHEATLDKDGHVYSEAE